MTIPPSPSIKCTITEASPHETLLVFDKDGVLLDINATWLPVVIAMGQYLEDKCGGATKRDDLLAAVGVNITPGTDEGIITENSIFAASTFAHMQDIWRKIEPKLAAVFDDIENYHADITAIRLTVPQGHTVPKGAVRDSLNQLKGMGFRLAVATNDNTSSAMVNLGDLGVEQLFDIIICADSGFGRKPEGGGLREACRATSISPARAIMVGDTATDFLAAEDAGFKGFITITNSAPQKPDFIPRSDLVVPTLDELPRKLIENNSPLI
jgi:phosphoglycolate phosphatase